jgi:VWFA-related protein
MRRFTSLAVAWLGCLCAVGHAQQPPPASTPQRVFRGGIDIVQVDVSVLDKNRRPVRGLTVADFTVLEDGRPRPVVAFTPVELPNREAAPSASWMRDVTQDVATNSRPEEGRLVVIMMDRSIPIGLPMNTARRIALAAVDQLAPGDLAAVVYTGNYAGSAAQNFTADRARLTAAINKPYTGDPVSKDAADITGPPGVSGECYCGLCVLDSITHVADAVRDVPQRRKILLFVGTRIVVQAPVTDDCSFPLKEARTKMFSAAQVANLTIHTLDPTGLETNALTAGSSVRATASTLPSGRARASAMEAMTAALADNNERQNTLGVLGQQTGGRTVFSGPAELMPEIFRESQLYYLLGFRRADQGADGEFHRIEVKVNRPGVDVRTRQGYYAPGEEPVTTVASRDTPSAPLMNAMAGVLPNKDLPLSLSVAPFAVAGKREAAVALVLSVRQRAIDIGSTDRIEILAAAIAGVRATGVGIDAQTECHRRRAVRSAVTVRFGARPLRDSDVR